MPVTIITALPEEEEMEAWATSAPPPLATPPPALTSSIGVSALTYAKAGIPIFPCRADKRPQTGHGFKDASHREATVREWWRRAPEAMIGVPCGSAVICLDIDAKYQADLVADFEEACRALGIDWLESLPKQRTPNGNGAHFLFRCTTEIGSMEIAHNVDGKTTIETRGTGAYFCVAPSKGYHFVRGSLLAIPEISPKQWEELVTVSLSFNRKAKKEAFTSPRALSRDGHGLTPGDDYNQRGDVLGLLRKHGWTTRRDENHWIRPGKKDGLSATWDKVPGKFYPFSSNANPFEPETSYSPFAVYAVLEHGGDFSQAATVLRAEGYGQHAQVIKPNDSANSDAITQGAVEECASRDQAGAADLLTQIGNGKIIFDHTAGIWRIYRNGIWGRDELRGVRRRARKRMQSYFRDAAQARRRQMDTMLENGMPKAEVEKSIPGVIWKNLMGQIANLNKRPYLDHVMALAADGEEMGTLTTEFDTNAMLFACGNGVIDLNMLTFREPSPKDMLSKRSLVEYMPEATCPKWDTFIDTIFCGDIDLSRFMQRLFGYCLTGDVGMDAVSISYGGGGNGKSVLYSVLAEIFGDYASHLPIESLLQQGNRRDVSSDYEKMKLLGARFVVASEIPEHRRINESLLKDISGGDLITARSPYEKPVTFKPTHKLHLMGNHKPEVRGTDDGIWRRLYLVPFSHRFAQPGEKGHRAKEDVLDELRAESSGILNWLLDGLRDLNANGLNPPTSVRAATDEFRKESDQIQQFIEEACIISKAYSTPINTLYETYKAFVEAEDTERPISKKAFSQSLERKGFHREHTGRERRFGGITTKK